MMKKSEITELDRKLALACLKPFNVILEGESGVGKERFAKLIHKKRPWAKDFINFDWECDYPNQLKIFDDLAENHLKEIIDFTSPQRNTYFFRRLDLLSPHIQTELFEILEREAKRGAIPKAQLYRLGLISSWEKSDCNRKQGNNFTHNPLKELFLYKIMIPPLRERKNEILSFLFSILQSVNNEQNRNVVGFSQESIDMLLGYGWPNNLDELESEIQRAVALTKDYEMIKPQVLSKKLTQNQVLCYTT